MGVFIHFAKNGKGELTVYNPLYDPTSNKAENNIQKADIAKYGW